MCESGERHRCASVRLKSNVFFVHSYADWSFQISAHTGWGEGSDLYCFPSQQRQRKDLLVFLFFPGLFPHISSLCSSAQQPSQSLPRNNTTGPASPFSPACMEILYGKIQPKSVVGKFSLTCLEILYGKIHLKSYVGKLSQNLLWENLA